MKHWPVYKNGKVRASCGAECKAIDYSKEPDCPACATHARYWFYKSYQKSRSEDFIRNA